MNKIFNKVLNFKLFDTKLGEKNNNLNFAHKIPAVLGKQNIVNDLMIIKTK